MFHFAHPLINVPVRLFFYRAQISRIVFIRNYAVAVFIETNSLHGYLQLPSSFCQPHSVHCPPGSPHPAHITSSQLSPSLSPSITPRSFTPDLKLISFTDPFLHSHSYSFRTAFTDLNLY